MSDLENRVKYLEEELLKTKEQLIKAQHALLPSREGYCHRCYKELGKAYIIGQINPSYDRCRYCYPLEW
mgnify:CR=1 FL=1